MNFDRQFIPVHGGGPISISLRTELPEDPARRDEAGR